MLFFDPPHFTWNDKTFYPQIISNQKGNVQLIAPGDFVEPDRPILWSLDLGLFKGLKKPLSNKQQFEELEKAILDFCENVLGNKIDQTLGVILFTGSLEDILEFPWDQTQHKNYGAWLKERGVTGHSIHRLHYACAVFNDFLELLTSGIGEPIEWFAQIDASLVTDPIDFYQLSNPSRYEHLHIFWKCYSDAMQSDFIWEIGTPFEGYIASTEKQIISSDEINSAICLPPTWLIEPSILDKYRALAQLLSERKINYKYISQEKIAQNWQGLDLIFTISEEITVSGKRQLMGFCAAGGMVVTRGNLLGLANEISFDEFILTHAT